MSIPLLRRSRRKDLVEVPARSDVLALASILLAYPDDAWYTDTDELAAAVGALPDSAPAAHLRAFLDQHARMEPRAARPLRRDVRPASQVVAVPQLLPARRHAPARHGAPRAQAALPRVRVHPDDAELPDYLPMVLEFASRAGTGAGEGRCGPTAAGSSSSAARSPTAARTTRRFSRP
ncbi:hypothetical protein NKG05_29750 [Oerskovia sp. M15]